MRKAAALLNKLRLEKSEGTVELDMSYIESGYAGRLDQYSYDDLKALVNICVLEEKINGYAAKGYRVKNIFVNELGKNPLAVVPKNATLEQIVIIFERVKVKK